MEYPTKNGIAIHPNEIWLPETELDLDFRPNHNNHHMLWTRRFFESCILLCTLRNLEELQVLIPNDIHSYIHARYTYPRPPTPKQALNRLEQAIDFNEGLKIRQSGGYVHRPLTNEVMKLCISNYDNLLHKDKW